MKTCGKCLLTKQLSDFKENRSWCNQCLNLRIKEWHIINKDKVKEHQKKSIRTIKNRFRVAVKQAKRRNKNWDLTIEQFQTIVEKDCFYCNGFFKKVETGTGLDRIINSKGYEIDNVVSCCTSCNKVKSDVLSFDETIKVIKLIIGMRTV